MPQMVILLVETESAGRQFTADVLQQADFIVLQARDAMEALSLARNRIEIALLLADVQMVGMDGIELVKLVSQERAEARVLIMSGFSDSLVAAAEEGFAVLTKPFTSTMLTEQVQKILEA
jgi:DNA-binding NtrC family response regulator